MPVADAPKVTVETKGLFVDGGDADASSTGEQRQAAMDGTLELAMRAGKQTGAGELMLSSGRARARIPVRILPTIRGLTAVGVGQIGAGATGENFGALTIRGAVSDEASVSVSYDSRRSSDNDFFAGGYDPLDQARYPTFGDASEQRTLAASTQRFTAKVERKLDWLALGDVQSDAFGTGQLTSYRRSLSGVSGKMNSGAITLSGFASLTQQAFGQSQLRGDGGSGPYVFGKGVRRGTDRVAIEVRDRENAALLVNRQELARFIDYSIDYATGAVLLRRPVPSADTYGNPIFVVATLEQDGVGDAHVVAGLRAETEVGHYLSMHDADSLTVAVSGVRGGSAPTTAMPVNGDANLLGADARLRRGALDATAEVLHAQSGDSSASAARAGARWLLTGDRASLDAEWLHVGEGFDRSLDPRLAAALSQISVGGAYRLSTGAVIGFHHERQKFAQFGIERRVMRANAEQRLFGRNVTQELNLSTDMRGVASGDASTLAGKFGVSVNSRMNVWSEAMHALGNQAEVATPRPDQLGLGVSYRLFDRLRLEAAHRQVRMPTDSLSYAVSSFGLRSEQLFGGQAWTSLERAASNRATSAAVLGWNQRLAIAKGWSANTMFERRVGLSKATLSDPSRALPFAQPEANRTSVAGGVEWLPGADRSRFSARSELHSGQDRTGNRFEVSGDIPLGLDAALITYNDWSQYHRETGSLTRKFTRQDRSLIGAALRPTGADQFNALIKLEWRRSLNPLGSLLSATAADSRFIGAADAVYSLGEGTEFAARYAVRWATTAAMVGGEAIASQAHYAGVRGERGLRGSLSMRADARLLVERSSGIVTWNAAPSLVYRLNDQIEFESGYRVGPLVDRDFAANAHAGLFASVSLRFTEKALAGPASFWRERLAGGR